MRDGSHDFGSGLAVILEAVRTVSARGLYLLQYGAGRCSSFRCRHFVAVPRYQIILLPSFAAMAQKGVQGLHLVAKDGRSITTIDSKDVVEHFVLGAGGITVCKEGSETRNQESLEIQQNEQGAGRFQM